MGDMEKEFLRFFSPMISELRVLRALQKEVSAYLGDPDLTPLETLMEVKRKRDSQEEGHKISGVHLGDRKSDSQ